MSNKKKRVAAFVLLFMIAFNALALNAMAYDTRIVWPVPAYKQEGGLWCWAACAKSIIQYIKGSSPTQSSIANTYGYGTGKAGSIDDANKAIKDNGVLTSIKYEKLTYSGVQAQITNKHPLFVRLQNGPVGHANVIRGYDSSTSFVLFVEPADGSYRGQNYTSYSAGIHWDGNYWTWTGTIFDTRK